jgi:hypothetical protein
VLLFFDSFFAIRVILPSGKTLVFRLIRYKISTDSDFADEALESAIYAQSCALLASEQGIVGTFSQDATRNRSEAFP